MKAPLIDNRDLGEVLKEMQELVPFFTPEWKPGAGKDSGKAVMEIWARMYAGIIQRLNRVPGKNMIAFLNMLCFKLLPATQARGPITFTLSSGAAEPVVIPARTQVAAQPASSAKPLVFETERSIMATPAKLTEAISYYVSQDRITQAPPSFFDASGGATFDLFTGIDINPVQSHAMYIGHPALFQIDSQVTFMLHFIRNGQPLPVQQLEHLVQLVEWGYATEDEDWHPMLAARKENWIELDTSNSAHIAEKSVNGVMSRWIRGVVKSNQIKQIEGTRFDTLSISIWNTRPPDLAFCNTIPLPIAGKEYIPFGFTPRLYDTFYLASQEAFSKKGANLTISFTLSHVADPEITVPPVRSYLGSIGMAGGGCG